MSNEERQQNNPERSALAERLENLKRLVLNVVSRRERVPQPLFWSLFHHRLEPIKAERAKELERKRSLYGIDW